MPRSSVGTSTDAGDDALEHPARFPRCASAFSRRKPASSANWNTSSTRPSARRHRLAAMDVHPEVGQDAGDVREEVRLVERDERQFPDVAVALEKRVHLVSADAARQAHVPVDGGEPEERQVAARQALEEARELVLGDVVGTAGDDDATARPDPSAAARRRSRASGGCRRRRRAARAGLPSTASASSGLTAPTSASVIRHSILSRSSEPIRSANCLTTCGIVEVAAERDLRHQQVIADQELDGPPRVGRQLEAVEHALRELHAFLRVLGLAPLADVVEEQRERQELRARAAPAGSS